MVILENVVHGHMGFLILKLSIRQTVPGLDELWLADFPNVQCGETAAERASLGKEGWENRAGFTSRKPSKWHIKKGNKCFP